MRWVIVLLCALVLSPAKADILNNVALFSGGTTINAPAGIPRHFALGLSNKSAGTTDLSWMTGSGIPWDYRYNYFGTTTTNAAGVYVSDSLMNGYIPVITRYTPLNSSWTLAAMSNTATMNSYYADFVAQLQSMAGWAGWYLQKSGSSQATISTDDTTVTYTGTSGTDDPVLSGNFHTAGKWVFRIHWNAVTGGGHEGLGISVNNLTQAYLGQAGVQSVALYNSGVYFGDAVISAQPAFTYATGDNIDVAIDSTVNPPQLWARQNNGNWNASGTASPGVSGGIPIAGLSNANPLAPAAEIFYNGSQAVFGTPPVIAGFSAWNSSPASPTMILHIEPDLWGFMQQQGGSGGAQTDDPTQVAVSVASSGYSGLGSLPNNAAGFAQALKLLRDTYAPSIYLAWHASTFGPNDGFVATNTSFSETPATTGQRVANFYNGLNTKFDLIFHDTTTGDRDSDYAVLHDGNTASSAWWTATSFENYRQFLIGLHQHLTNPTYGLLWQIATGNDLYLSCNDGTGGYHYQDNKAEFFLTAGSGVAQGVLYSASNISNFISAGIIGILFGQGQQGQGTLNGYSGNDTDNYDYAGDGITNPAAYTGGGGQTTSKTATVSDDDGGFLRAAASLYYAAPVRLN